MNQLLKRPRFYQKIIFSLFVILVIGLASLAYPQTVQHVPALPGSEQRDILIISFPVQGWYLVSLPLTVADSSLATLFPTALGAFAWENNQYVSADTIGVGRGYWLSIPGPTAAVIQGDSVGQFSGHFMPGWHIIGSVLGNEDFSDPNDTPDGSVLVPAFRWNGNIQRYSTGVFDIEQSFGHWIAVVQECDLTVGDTSMTVVSNRVSVSKRDAFYKRFGAAPPRPPFELPALTSPVIPEESFLFENYPNPFNPETVIRYRLAQKSFTSIVVYNTLGQEVRRLLQATQPRGIYVVKWDGRDFNGQEVNSGVYFYQLISGHFSQTKKMLLVR